ncbi:MAG: methyltransferase domain-containing protein [Candidatus Zixiibacteriota bacterium]
MNNGSIDAARAEAFAGRLIELYNGGGLALMISIGHRTGLFDVMDGMTSATSYEIARRAGLSERYVREWLGAMTVGKIVECDPNGPRYSLPREHSAFLTRDSSPNNMAVFAQYIPLLGQVEDKIVARFRSGEGLPYSEYNRFHEVMAEDSGQTVVSALLDSILPLVPQLPEALSRGIDVLDIGCGAGRALNLMAKHFPKSRFYGFDISEEAIKVGWYESRRAGLFNVYFETKDLTDFEPNGQKWDLITAFDAVHDQAQPEKVLADIAGALKPGGTFLMQDIAGSAHHYQNIDHPVGPLLYAVSCMHCVPVSLAQGGAGLGAMWGEEKARELLSRAGFKKIETRKLAHDFQNNFYIGMLQ